MEKEELIDMCVLCNVIWQEEKNDVLTIIVNMLTILIIIFGFDLFVYMKQGGSVL